MCSYCDDAHRALRARLLVELELARGTARGNETTSVHEEAAAVHVVQVLERVLGDDKGPW